MALTKPVVRTRTSNPNATYNQPSRASLNSSGDAELPPDTSEVPEPLSSADLISGDPLRELILLGGKDGVGKTSALVSIARYVEITTPDSTVYVIDTENKFRSAMRSFGDDAPGNIQYFQTQNMNQVTAVTRRIVSEHKPGDWVLVESMSRIWERAQDLGYMAVSGYTKPEYMEIRRNQEGKKAAPTPQPDQLWSITKHAYDAEFLEPLTQLNDLNVAMSTILSKPPKQDGFMKENPDRKAIRMELGIDCGLEGSPRLVYQVETLCLMELKGGDVTCRVLRDNLTRLEDGRVEFAVATRKDWANIFFSECR